MTKQLLMMLILVSVAIAGILHGGSMHHAIEKEILVNKEYINHYPEPMPNVVLDPMATIPF